jgi:hypothetical protein
VNNGVPGSGDGLRQKLTSAHRSAQLVTLSYGRMSEAQNGNGVVGHGTVEAVGMDGQVFGQ